MMNFAGEPLTIAYVNPPASRLSRRNELRSNYFFDCVCERCEREAKALEVAKTPMTTEASAGETCAERVAQAATALAEEDYTTALALLLGDERVEAVGFSIENEDSSIEK